MNRIALRAVIATVAIAPMIVLGAGVASAIPVVRGGTDGAPITGDLEDTDATVGNTCVVFGPGVGFASQPAGAPTAVNGFWTGPGFVNGACLNTNFQISTPNGYVR